VIVAAAAARTGPELISKLKEGVNMNALKTLCVVTNSLVVPTPMGVPLSLNVSAAGVFKLDGIIKANSLPEPSHFLLRRPFMSKKIEIVTDIKPRYDIRRLHRGSTGSQSATPSNSPLLPSMHCVG